MVGFAPRKRPLCRLILRANAPGAEVKMPLLAIYHNCRRVNIEFPAPVGMNLGMAHIAAELG